MQSAVDVVVIGAGHNGLVAATYLARAGHRVVVLERRPVVGGPVTTEELRPGFRAPTGAALCGLLRREIVEELQLTSRGLGFLPLDPAVVVLGGAKPLRLWRDVKRSQFEIAKASPADAAAFPRFRDLMLRIAKVLDPLLLSVPTSAAAPGLTDELFLFRRALGLRGLGREAMYEALRIPPMCVRDVLREWFETEALHVSLALDALSGVFHGPWSPFTAFGLIHRYVAELNGGWAFVRGGSGALSDVLAQAAAQAGATIRTGVEVKRILSPDGRAAGVELASGETIPARAVVSTADPKRTFLSLADPADLGADFLMKVRNIRMDGCVAKVNMALGTAPKVPALDGDALPPRLQVAPSLEYIERAYDDAKHGVPSESPTLDVAIPTAVDPSLAPAGKHILSVLVQYEPYRLRRGTWDDFRAGVGERVLDLLEPHMPNLRSALEGMEVLTPADLEARFGLTGGHMHHGEMTMNQQYVLRPVPGWGRYRTPIRGLYLCGAGAHPGGGITGAPGYNGAHAVLEDWSSLMSA